MSVFDSLRVVLCSFVMAGVVALFFIGCSFDPEDPAASEASENQDDSWEFEDEDEEDGEQEEEALDAGVADDAEAVIDAEETDDDAPEPDSGPVVDAGDDDLLQQVDAGEEGDADDGTEPEDDPIQECDGEEVDTATSATHCGGCNNECDGEFGSCDSGTCTCPDGFEACGDDNRCEYVDQDPSHCGGCGIECGPGERCQDGDCVCRDGLSECGGECVDTDRNPNHCGACDEDCGLGHCADGECGSGGCSLASSFECEPDDSDGLSCMPWQGASNSLYCAPSIGNSCGEVCAGNEICQPGAGCFDYRAARGCDACPCDDCAVEERCIDDMSTIDGVYCIRYDDWSSDDDGWW